MIFRENVIYRKLHRRDFDFFQPEACLICFAYLYDLHFLIALRNGKLWEFPTSAYCLLRSPLRI